MGCIIIAMPKHEDARRLGDIIKRSDIWEELLILEKGSEILQSAQNREIDLVICTKKLKDMGYEELATYLPTGISILLITKNASLDPFSANVVKLLMPFRAEELIGSVKTILPSHHYDRRRKKPRRSLQDQKVIDEAKHLLMERNGMSEPEAFRYLQKTSMDTGRSFIETARMILLLNSE